MISKDPTLKMRSFADGRFLLAVCVLVASSGSLFACPFCAKLGKTYSDALLESEIVVVGVIEANPASAESSILRVSRSIKVPRGTHLGATRTIRKQMPATTPAGTRLMFASELEGDLIPHRVMNVSSTEFVDYLAKCTLMLGKPTTDRLPFFFHYLEHEDAVIAEDAYKEFSKADYREVLACRSAYDVQKLIRYLEHEQTAKSRLGLYGLLLGTTRDPVGKQLFPLWIKGRQDHYLMGLDGLLAGWSLLDRKAARDHTLFLLLDPQSDFSIRYPALQTIKFLLGESASHDRSVILASLQKGIGLNDVGDLVIDVLRKEKAWESLPAVLARSEPSSVREKMWPAVVRFAIACPKPKAKDFLRILEKEEPARVRDAEQALKFEAEIEAQFAPGDQLKAK